jgi:5-methylcytosine-specific restriction endonuclease McrA
MAVSYNSILAKYHDRQIPYHILLRTIEWQKFRKEVHKRDNGICINCSEVGNQTSLLNYQIHHSYYIVRNRRLVNPWEYPLSSVITLCGKHHTEFHDKHGKVPVYKYDDLGNQVDLDESEYKSCDKCDGKGRRLDLPGWDKYETGLCFKCWGSGIVFLF